MILPEPARRQSPGVDLKIPARGNIYDRGWEALAAQADAMALGVIRARSTMITQCLVEHPGHHDGKTSSGDMGMLEDALPQITCHRRGSRPRRSANATTVISGMAGLCGQSFSLAFLL